MERSGTSKRVCELRSEKESATRGRNKAITLSQDSRMGLGGRGFRAGGDRFRPRAALHSLDAALRLARAAERSGAAIIVLAQQRMCGTFAVLSLELSRQRAHFNRIARGACATFDGQALAAHVMRNKLGGAGGTALWSTAVDPHASLLRPSNSFVQTPAPAADRRRSSRGRRRGCRVDHVSRSIHPR